MPCWRELISLAKLSVTRSLWMCVVTPSRCDRLVCTLHCVLPCFTPAAQFWVSLAQQPAFVPCCKDGALSYSDLSSFFPCLLKHSFHEEWLDTVEKLPSLVHVVIWADVLPMSPLVSLSGPFLFLRHIQNIYFLTGLGHWLLKTSFCLLQVQDYHGHKICDPYAWLEDPDSEQTKVILSHDQQP